MKVVLFCGGQGLRLRDYSENIPKPMVNVGYRPILWHIMKYYAHFGHKDFILLLGHKGDAIKNYFVNYDEYITNDFVYSNGGTDMKLLNTDIKDWTITFVDSGLNANIGERLMTARKYLNDEEIFLANYSDGLSDLPLNTMIDDFKQTDYVGSFLAYQPYHSFHVVTFDNHCEVKNISPMGHSGLWINAGYFVFRNSIFDFINKGEDLVHEPFLRLIEHHKLMAYKYKGFWQSMDTFKDKQKIDDMYIAGNVPWEVWKAKNNDYNPKAFDKAFVRKATVMKS